MQTSRHDGSNAATTAIANGKLPKDDASATNAAGTTELADAQTFWHDW